MAAAGTASGCPPAVDVTPRSEAVLRRPACTVVHRIDVALQGDIRMLFTGAAPDSADPRAHQRRDDVRHVRPRLRFEGS